VQNLATTLPIALETFYIDQEIDQEIEVCAVKLHHRINNICILTVYRAPKGNVTCFLNSLETILNTLYTKSINIILCDVNINYLNDAGTNKIKLHTLPTTYHLCSIADFPSRITSTSATAIDNFFIDKHRN
jgi:hypothetical protein